jgi:hypothetical protein
MLRALPSVLLMGCSSDRVEKIIKVRVAPVPEIAADVSRLLRKDKGFSESQLAFKGEEITDHLGIPPCNDWHQDLVIMGEALIEKHAETSQDWEWWERTMLRALPSVLLMGCSSDRVGKNC